MKRCVAASMEAWDEKRLCLSRRLREIKVNNNKNKKISP